MTDETRNSVNRLGQRLDERIDTVNERLTENFDKVLAGMDGLKSDLRDGSSDRVHLIKQVDLVRREVEGLQERITMIEDTQAKAVIGAAVVAGASAKAAVKAEAKTTASVFSHEFWSTSTGRIVKWAAGISGVGAAIQVMPEVTQFVENTVVAIYTLMKGGK